jgi:hypothetical protein
MTVTVDPGTEGLAEYRQIQLRELLERYDIVDVRLGDSKLGTESYIVVSEHSPLVQLANPPNISVDTGFQEMGYASPSPYTAWTREERIGELRDRLGTRKYYDMKRNDGTIRGALLAIKTPIRAAHWYIEPGEDTTSAHNIANFVAECLFVELNVDFSQVLDDILLMFEYGYMVLEKVYKFRRDGKVGLRKLAPRHPLDIREWLWDREGGPNGIIMEPGVLVRPSATTQEIVEANRGMPIPIEKLAIFSLEAEAGDLRGISVLRSAFKHWYYKDTLYKIDAIQKERHGIGIPVIKLPPGFSEADKRTADELGRNLRTNEKAHIVIPANWEILFAKLEGQPVSCIESIDHHDKQIHVNVVAPLKDHNPGPGAMDLFYKSTRYLADNVAAIFNKFIIRQLVDLNFVRGPYPTLRVRRIGEWEDLRTYSFALRNFIGAGAITPDDVLEAELRDAADLPHQDFATARFVNTPQGSPEDEEGGSNPSPSGASRPVDMNKPSKTGLPRVGPPRQARAVARTPQRNAGRDNSGGG